MSLGFPRNNWLIRLSLLALCLFGSAASPISGLAWAQGSSKSKAPWAVRWKSNDAQCTQKPMEALLRGLVADSSLELVPVIAVAMVQLLEARYRVVLTTKVGGHIGKRRFSADSCQEIQAGVALLLAMILEAKEPPLPALANDKPPTKPIRTSVPEPRPADSGVNPVAASPAPVSSPGAASIALRPVSTGIWRGQVRALTNYGAIPGLASGLGLRLGWEWQDWELALATGGLWGSQSAEIPGAQIAARRVEASFAVCRTLFHWSEFAASSCVSGGAHQDKAYLEASGTETARTFPAQLQAGAQARGIYEFSRFYIGGEALLGVEQVHPYRGICRPGSSLPDRCESNQFTARQLQFGLRAGFGTRF